MRPLLCSPSPHPACTRLLWQCQQLERCLIRLLQALDLVVIELAGEPKEDLLAAVCRAWLLVGDPWDGAEDMWPPSSEGDVDV